MIPLADIQRRILDAVAPLGSRRVGLGDALGLVLAQDVATTEDVPPFANTAMDGYAVRAADTAGATGDAPVRLRVVADLRAGQAPDTAVGAGEAIRIMTGAPIPPGADAVVMVERTEAGDGDVAILEAAAPGDHVRAAGGDLRAGQLVFPAGSELRAAHIGVLASVGVTEVLAFPRARVGVVSTGDELVEEGSLAPGQIRDSNRPMLLALLAEAGCEPVGYGIARDDEAVITERITRAVDECDALLTSGGVSVGDYDYVKAVLGRLASERTGSEFGWHQVAIKPAKPLAFGTLGKVPVFGLPGNPVSSHVSFELFARPALRRLMGHPPDALFRPEVLATAASPMPRKPDGKVHFDRVRVWLEDGRFRCERSGSQSSNVLSAMAAAGGLAVLPDGPGVGAGDEVRVMLLS